MSSTMSEQTSSATDELPVTFRPALFLQRRGWVFEVMSREGVRRVLDIGCGEGETIACMCNPAPWLLLQSCPGADEADPDNAIKDFLHIETIYALDISSHDLRRAVELTAPPPPPPPNGWQGHTRWEPLEVKLWEGGMESYNPEFVDMECIISTEVIEHLPEDLLPEFAPVLLGLYHPRLLLITTPSYTFNARFTAPDAPSSARNGYLDPTRRTNRIFRHDDHKFEWTVEEFTSWCTGVAAEWGYDVEISGVGRPSEKDRWDREEELGCASQTAAFKRREGQTLVKAREERVASMGTLQKAATRSKHELIATHQHQEHENARKPGSFHDIGLQVMEKMKHYQEARLRLHELWFEHDIGLLCGGSLHLLVMAVETREELRLLKPSSVDSKDWIVEWVGFVPQERLQPLWPQGQKEEEKREGNNAAISRWPGLPAGWGVTGDIDECQSLEGISVTEQWGWDHAIEGSWATAEVESVVF